MLHYGYFDLLEPKVNTTANDSYFFLRPSFKEHQLTELYHFEHDTPADNFSSPCNFSPNFKEVTAKLDSSDAESPKPIQKKKSKTLGDKGNLFSFAQLEVGVWNNHEHELFLKGYDKYGRNWSLISKEFVTTRTRQQVRSHAQKFFRKHNIE
jgi:SHAQKYF class myb-like DNA-binding protein